RSHTRSPTQVQGQPGAHCSAGSGAPQEPPEPASEAAEGEVPLQSPPSNPQELVLQATSQKPSPIHWSMQPSAQLGMFQLSHTRWPWAWVKKSSGHTSLPSITSSLK